MITAITSLNTEQVIALARERADAGDSTRPDFLPGSTEAIAYEKHYMARIRELEEVEA